MNTELPFHLRPELEVLPVDVFLKAVKFWSNDIGDYFDPDSGESIPYTKLPVHLWMAAEIFELWKRTLPYSCFLAEYRGKDKIVFSIEITESMAIERFKSMAELLDDIKGYARMLMWEDCDIFGTAQFIILKHDEERIQSQEFFICMPALIARKDFDRAVQILTANPF